MKTLHLTNSWHQTSGGIATFYRALFREANRRNQQIRLVVPGDSDRIEEVGEYGRIYEVAAPPAQFNAHYRTLYPARFLGSRSKVQDILRSERPDLVEICDKYTLPYLGGLLRRQLLPGIDFRPTVVGLTCERMDDNVHSYLGEFPFRRQFCSLYMKWLYFPFFDHHIANSQYTAEELRPASIGQVVQRGTWVRPMGVDLGHLSPARRSAATRAGLLEAQGLPEDSVLLLYVGRLVPEKNLALLFELVNYLAQSSRRDYRLLVAGTGIEKERWETYTEVHSPRRVRFLGHIADREQLADIYANADVFIHPNPREPFGIAPLEAMVSGLPLVAPNAGGVTSYANRSNAWTVEPKVDDFAAAVEEVISDRTAAESRIAKALLTAREYSWEAVASSFLDLYDQLCRNGSGHATAEAPEFSTVEPVGLSAVFFRTFSNSAEKIFTTVTQFLDSHASRNGDRRSE